MVHSFFNFEKKVTPFGWPKEGQPGPQGPYYCSIGFENSYGRGVAEAHYRACLYADIPISGINGEVMPGQWEYQVGPAVGINGADDLVMSRFLLQRVAEDLQVVVSLDPKVRYGEGTGVPTVTGCGGGCSGLTNNDGFILWCASCSRVFAFLLERRKSRARARGSKRQDFFKTRLSANFFVVNMETGTMTYFILEWYVQGQF